MKVNEDNIIKLLQKNLNEAYFYLYKKLYAPLSSFAFNYIRNKNAANDIVQEIFVSLLTTKKKFESYDELKFYLYKAVKNKSINYIRFCSVRDNFNNSDIEMQIFDGEDENFFFQQILEEDVYSNLLNAIDQLPPQMKSVIQLTMEGYKIAEIANKLSISSSTVKEHKSLAKNRLRGIIKRIDQIYIFIILWIISNLR